jgi:hypothetical protein
VIKEDDSQDPFVLENRDLRTWKEVDQEKSVKVEPHSASESFELVSYALSLSNKSVVRGKSEESDSLFQKYRVYLALVVLVVLLVLRVP